MKTVKLCTIEDYSRISGQTINQVIRDIQRGYIRIEAVIDRQVYIKLPHIPAKHTPKPDKTTLSKT